MGHERKAVRATFSAAAVAAASLPTEGPARVAAPADLLSLNTVAGSDPSITSQHTADLAPRSISSTSAANPTVEDNSARLTDEAVSTRGSSTTLILDDGARGRPGPAVGLAALARPQDNGPQADDCLAEVVRTDTRAVMHIDSRGI